MSYYQGMNYIAIFLYKTFQDELKAYQFLCYISEKYLTEKLEKSFKGLMEMIFLSDKLFQITNQEVWQMLQSGQMSSIHFSVPLIITVFTTYVKEERNFDLIYTIWDLFLTEGFLSVLKAQLCILKIQEKFMEQVESDMMLMAMKNFEKTPFSVPRYLKIEDEIIDVLFGKLTKQKILEEKVDESSFDRLVKHYWKIHQPILKFWSEN